MKRILLVVAFPILIFPGIRPQPLPVPQEKPVSMPAGPVATPPLPGSWEVIYDRKVGNMDIQITEYPIPAHPRSSSLLLQQFDRDGRSIMLAGQYLYGPQGWKLERIVSYGWYGCDGELHRIPDGSFGSEERGVPCLLNKVARVTRELDSAFNLTHQPRFSTKEKYVDLWVRGEKGRR